MGKFHKRRSTLNRGVFERFISPARIAFLQSDCEMGLAYATGSVLGEAP